MDENFYMRKVLFLAKKGSGYVSPNPLVGAVLVKNGKIIGKGYHEYFGGNHAEVNAIISAGDSVRGSALFVNLEPCVHFGKTPPCVDSIIKSGIKEVVISHLDPNPVVNGKGAAKLLKAGIKVKVGVLEEKSKLLNEIFLKFISQKRPFVILKAGISLDGKIAAKGGDSKWITGERSRDCVYSLRSKTDAVLVGIKTVLADNPYLTSHGKGIKKNPKKIILDTRGRIPLDSNVFKEPKDLIVVTTKSASKVKIKKIEKTGAEVLFINKIKNRIDLNELLKKLGEKNIASLLVEGGSEVNGSFIDSKLVDKVLFFISPMIIGGKEAYSSIGGEGINALKNAVKLKNVSVRKIGQDYLFEGYPIYK
ncbi:MAG: bifunctional diaminohydroxyphosphoribosylaminopyrimidine deaminase/5-amino-6-(5-phosphoribosylamino)uracil reductase RibD [bacterium]|nr:bifunctional diaminohydroxyphosphoribosylaminopyrimidine deaminase/5-amino-6-(5-phosphoribosylamino)uracil reductase RibD [bacterium]